MELHLKASKIYLEFSQDYFKADQNIQIAEHICEELFGLNSQIYFQFIKPIHEETKNYIRQMSKLHISDYQQRRRFSSQNKSKQEVNSILNIIVEDQQEYQDNIEEAEDIEELNVVNLILNSKYKSQSLMSAVI